MSAFAEVGKRCQEPFLTRLWELICCAGGQKWFLTPFSGPRHFQTYFAKRSVSRFTLVPGCLNPRVVLVRVCGISATLNRSLLTSTSVRLTPSTATDPLGTI